MTKLPFSSLGISPEILKAIEAMGYTEASFIQTATIPAILQGQDIIGQSQTGSGKTAAFAIPALEKIDTTRAVTQVLVMCPTRELALQVTEEFEKLGKFKKGIRVASIIGGTSYVQQNRQLKQGAHIVVGTPGRIIDHIDQKTLSLAGISMVILDEVDRMLDMGFRDDIQNILKRVPSGRQLICFSATLSPEIQGLIRQYANNVQLIKISQTTATVQTIEQLYYVLNNTHEKLDALIRLLTLNNYKLVIIFCNTKRMVDQLTDALLMRGYRADRLHSDIKQNTRTRVIDKFRKAQGEILVATDVAARGIDLDNVEVVINYDLPKDIENYVHRIGRTGRAGKSGIAISFVNRRELYQLRQIERFTNMNIREAQLPTAAEVTQKQSAALTEQVQNTINTMPQTGTHSTLVDALVLQGHDPLTIAKALAYQAYCKQATIKEAAPSHRRSDERQDRRHEPRRGGGSYFRSRRPRSSRPRSFE